MTRDAAARVVEDIRALYGPHFAIADRANAVAMRALPLLEPSKTDNARLVAAVLFGRILTSFQAGHLLAERGLCADAGTVVRAQVESTIILGALIRDPPDVLNKFIARDRVNRRKILAAWLDDPQAINAMTPEQQALFRERLAEVQREDPNLSSDPINVYRLAETSGLLWLYNTPSECFRVVQHTRRSKRWSIT